MKLGAEAPVHQREFSRRRFLAGTAGVGVILTVGAFAADSLLSEPWAYADGPTTGLPKTATKPEQIHLTWGGDPSTQLTVSWASPGLTAMPNATLYLDTAAVTTSSPTKTVAAVSYTDGMNLETVHCYHAAITGLAPATTYNYLISDGASPASTVAGSFTTAPSGRAKYTFSSVGDVATPTANFSSSGLTWAESSDNAHYLPLAVENSAPLFHLLNGDLCYANLNTNNQPEVWRDFGNNLQVSASKRPWMPCLGNHEIEFGANNQDGSAATNGHWNGAHGYASYQARYLLPDNGLAGMRGYFYSFQVGTVLFISLDADDVAFQDGGSYYAPAKNADGSFSPLTATNNPAISIPPGFSTYNRQYTGALTTQASDDSIVPDMSTASPNEQTLWLQRTLAAARSDGSIDMIVVQMHQCMLSSSAGGNGSDLGIRKAWQPLFDQYSVDIVVNGHDHDYERTFAVRGYDAGTLGTVVAPNPSQTAAGQVAGTAVDTRRPSTITAAGPFPTVVGTTTYSNGFDTSKGTVYLTLGGGGTDGPTDTYGTTSTGAPQAKVITTRNQIYVASNGNYTRNAADSVEPAPWSAQRDTVDAYGYATFAVDPGTGPGKTTITMTYFHAPQASGGVAPFQGTTSYTPYEVVVFGRGIVNASPNPALPEFGMPAVAAGAALALGGAAMVARRRTLAAAVSEETPEPIAD